MITACIFDLDGVLVDSAKYHYLAWKALADKLGFEFTEKHNERLKGVSRMKSLEILLEVGGITMTQEEKEKAATEKNELYRSYISKMTPDEILPGVETFLKEIKALGIKTSIGSASKNTSLIMERTGLSKYFDAVADGTMVTKAKPDPEVFLKGAELLNTDPKECVVFEDAEAGVEAAHNAGMRAVGIGSTSTLGKAEIVIPGFTGFDFKTLKDKID
ncbi:MAG: beta-phosphoglucomutase [Bacteroidales bacterium]|nr:beta-phosphoglucomutase [Bacteroidales bacterium]